LEPGALATEVALRPREVHALLNILPLARAEAADAVDQPDSVVLSRDLDIAGRYVSPGPFPAESQARPQAIVPVQLPNVKRFAGFARLASTGDVRNFRRM
jgi:hypothetical protein